MERSIMTLTEQEEEVMEDVVRQEEEVREIREDMKTDQNLIIIRFNTHKDAVDKLIQKVEEKVSFLENSQREELVQLASLEEGERVRGHLQQVGGAAGQRGGWPLVGEGR